MTESEPVSLEFIEDPYLPKLDSITTPSLDEITEQDQSVAGTVITNCYDDWSDEIELYLRNLTLDQIFYDVDSDYTNTLELQTVETEFIATKLANQTPSSSIAKRFRLKFFTKRTMREVKVTFIDFSKPYLAKISSSDNYKKFLNIGSCTNSSSKDNAPKMSEPTSPAASVASADIAAEFAALTVEEQEQQRAEWSQELARVEEEIVTLRTVLASKTRHASDLKRKLGITVWKEITDDMNQGLKNVKESSVFQSVEQSVGNITKAVHDAPIFQRTESVLKSTSEKTASVFGSITSGISSKFSQMKNSDSMRSIEEKVGSAYENVKTKVSTSRSGSVTSFPDALNENNSSGLNSPTNSTDK
ncbi:tumor protein D54-like isoform X6 [Teleopsis dalmanni]|uniref:tumor protein D54-like isoform X10 n=1 Tax=Teleopsis dalmanni TaxID=139649 RepID=UPI0018CDC746|nr:tumor protein D54-like isoform X10 [Teleopsis dalmanni]XP_037949089.1 tumor protein D54-like isoform X6 [Teleopsis dalmanni]